MNNSLHELFGSYDISYNFTMPHRLWTMTFLTIRKVIRLMAGMGIVLGYPFTITTGHKHRNSFAYFLLSVYIIYSILYAAYRMLHIIWFYRTQHSANQGKGRIVGN